MNRRLEGPRYGGLGFPLAFVALPLYVQLPAHYAQQFGAPLAGLGLLLLGARLLDALIDPWLGRRADAWLNEPGERPLRRLDAAALLLLLPGFVLLFYPPAWARDAWLLPWCGLCLLPTYLGYSMLSISHQAWGARLGGGALRQTRLNAWREGLALAGVLAASVLPGWAGMGASCVGLGLSLLLALTLLRRAPRATSLPAASEAGRPSAAQIWRTPGFRPLLTVFLLNGIAAAVPATLLLFFVRDRLQTPQAEGLYLVCYFSAAALALPLWMRLVARLGPARSWAGAMSLALLGFAGAAGLQAGERAGFVAVCLASGAALGADLAIPGALLQGLVQRAGLAGRAEGVFFGWWNAASKLNLALAAGLALPLLQALGYQPGQRDAQAQLALSLAYALLPCLLKLLALILLRQFVIPPEQERPCPPTQDAAA